MGQGKKLLLITLIIVIVASMSYPRPVNTEWQREYKEKTIDLDSKYFQETRYYDISSKEVQEVVRDIEATAHSPEEAIQKALNYVYYNIRFVSTRIEPNEVCFTTKASDTIKRGTGQCDTMSRLFITLARGLGIAAMPKAGCITITDMCYGTFAIYEQPLPQFTPITPAQIEELTVFPRGTISGLHTWASVYFPEKGWLDVEPTLGIYAEDMCAIYTLELIPANTQEECVSTNKDFALKCAKGGFVE